MSLYHRYKRRRGCDTTTEIVHEEETYNYKIKHLNGEVTECEENKHTRDEGFLLILEADDKTWARITFYLDNDITCKSGFGGDRGYDTVRELEGVQEVNREKLELTDGYLR